MLRTDSIAITVHELRDTFCPVNVTSSTFICSLFYRSRERHWAQEVGHVQSMILINFTSVRYTPPSEGGRGKAVINPVKQSVNQLDWNNISKTLQTSDHETGELTGVTYREMREHSAFRCGSMVEGKSKAINSSQCVNSHRRVRIGSDHDWPLGQTKCGAFVVPQHTID